MKMKRLVSVLACAALTLGATGVVQAANQQNFVVKLGLADVEPKADNGDLLGGAVSPDVGNSVRPSITFEYLPIPSVGIELLAAWPFRNDVNITSAAVGNGTAASVNVLPPTLSVQYHILPENVISPFVGVGINYSFIYGEDTKGPLAGNKLDLDNTWGFAAHFGLDFNISKDLLITVDGRWIQMRSDAKLNGAPLGTVDIDPFVWGMSIGYRF